jgi:nitrite reductase/ring-hydroxylating ferredoxin subunit
MSANLIRICSVDDVESGSHAQFRVSGLEPVAVYHVEGKFYVSADACTHQQASLGEEGFLEGHVIQCTWHNGKFDIRTGEVVALPCPAALKMYRVTVSDGSVFVEA